MPMLRHILTVKDYASCDLLGKLKSIMAIRHNFFIQEFMFFVIELYLKHAELFFHVILWCNYFFKYA
jgi:hypothetical protein